MTPFDHFFSDPHFGHANIIGYANRPFVSLEQMNATLQVRYISTVGEADTVLWLGDVSFGDEAWTTALLKTLPGRKVLVRGNHDGTVAHCLRMGFDFVTDSLSFMIGRHKVTACHFPPSNQPEGWLPKVTRRPPQPAPGEFVIHGHTHARERRVGQRIHVGVDAWNYRPVSLAEVADLMEAT